MRTITVKQALQEAMREAMSEDPSVIFLGEDIGVYGGSFGVAEGLHVEFGKERVLETPISEAGFTSVAVGAAMTGLRPVVEIMFFDFVTLTMDALVNQAAKMRYMSGGQLQVPMVLRGPAGSGTGAAAQHSQSLESWFCHVPGLKVVCPSNPQDAKHLLKASIRDNNPVVFMEEKLLYDQTGTIDDSIQEIPLGAADIKKHGSDLTVISYGYALRKCHAAALHLMQEGIDVEVLDLRTLVPLDQAALFRSAAKTGKVLIVHSAVQRGGYGAELSAQISEHVFSSLKAPVLRLGGADVPIPFQKDLEEAAVPSVEDIMHKMRALYAFES